MKVAGRWGEPRRWRDWGKESAGREGKGGSGRKDGGRLGGMGEREDLGSHCRRPGNSGRGEVGRGPCRRRGLSISPQQGSRGEWDGMDRTGLDTPALLFWRLSTPDAWGRGMAGLLPTPAPHPLPASFRGSRRWAVWGSPAGRQNLWPNRRTQGPRPEAQGPERKTKSTQLLLC